MVESNLGNVSIKAAATYLTSDLLLLDINVKPQKICTKGTLPQAMYILVHVRSSFRVEENPTPT